MNKDFLFWISKLNDLTEDEDEVLASIDMLELIMNEEAVHHLLKIIVEGSRSRRIQESAAKAISQIAGGKWQAIIQEQRMKLQSSEQNRLFGIALSEANTD